MSNVKNIIDALKNQGANPDLSQINLIEKLCKMNISKKFSFKKVFLKKKDPLFHGIPENRHFYFVHSYHILPSKINHYLGTSNYGYSFVSAVRKDNLWGVQFHPEKSQNAGLKLLENFCMHT